MNYRHLLCYKNLLWLVLTGLWQSLKDAVLHSSPLPSRTKINVLYFNCIMDSCKKFTKLQANLMPIVNVIHHDTFVSKLVSPLVSLHNVRDVHELLTSSNISSGTFAIFWKP